MMMICTVTILTVLLAYANGANDNGKGVATLVGFGAAAPRRALLWATLTTAIGAAFSFWVAGGMIDAFKARLFAAGTPLDAAFFVAVLAGAMGWVMLATFTGMPVSTTHSIVGGLVGAGLVAFGPSQILWSFLGRGVGLPLLIGPLISLALVYLCAWPIAAIARRYASRCLCVTRADNIDAMTPAGAAVATDNALVQVVTGSVAECAATNAAVTVTTSTTANAVHWLSSGLVGFARGWNDAPKIAALSLVALTATEVANPAAIGFAIVTAAMAIGGYTAGRRVLETMAKKVTPLPLAESLTASMTTALLVSSASWASLPVSTTHVSTGAIVGAGLKNNSAQVKWFKVTEIVLSWLVTLPVAGLVAAAVMRLLRTPL